MLLLSFKAAVEDVAPGWKCKRSKDFFIFQKDVPSPRQATPTRQLRFRTGSRCQRATTKQFHSQIHAVLQISELDFSFVFSPVYSDNVTLDARSSKVQTGEKVDDAVKQKIDGIRNLVTTILRWKLYI